MSKTAQATAAAPAREQIPRVASLHVDPERIARMWAMSPTQRLQAAQTGQLTLGETESGRCSYWITRWGWSSSTSARQAPTRSRHSGAPSLRSWPARCGSAASSRSARSTRVRTGGSRRRRSRWAVRVSSTRQGPRLTRACASPHPATRSARRRGPRGPARRPPRPRRSRAHRLPARHQTRGSPVSALIEHPQRIGGLLL